MSISGAIDEPPRTVEADTVLITDSNGKYIKAKQFSRNTKKSESAQLTVYKDH